MTIDDVKRRIEALVILDRKEFGGKPHEAEDLIHQDVLRAIADGTAEDPRAMAAEALKTLELDLTRWYE